MSEETPKAALPDRPTYVRGPKGHFTKGAPGRPKGIKDRRTRVDMELMTAIGEKHLRPTLERLLRSKSERIRFETMRWVGEMILGRPRQSLEVAGGLGDLATELAGALAEVRSRRAALPAIRVDSEERGLPVDEKHGIGPEIAGFPHNNGMTALPAPRENAPHDAPGAAISVAVRESRPGDDRAVDADVVAPLPVVTDTDEEKR